MFLYFNTILSPAAVRLNRVTILGLTPSLGCRAIQSHGFVSIIATRYNRAINDNYNGMPEAAQAKAMTRAAIDGNLTELNLGGIRQTASELALHSLAQGFKPNDDYEKMQFYYHPDHLGSSSYITNLDGEVSQHIEYVPFGEVFIEERNNTWNTPYLFNAKEFDEETGLYYYGARYYEPRLSLWMSVDPIANLKNWISPYAYTKDNPLRYIDPDGQDEWEINKQGKIVKHIKTDKHDAFYIVNYRGKRIRGKSISFTYGTVEKATGQKNDRGLLYDVYQVRGDKQGTSLFEYFSKNTSVEWSQMQTGFKGKRGLNYITTSHQHSTETGMADLFDKQLKNGYTLRSNVHSHPENTPYPSGLNGGSGDIPYAQWITDESKQNPSFKIYLPGKGTYVKFSPNSSPEDFGFGIPTYNLKGVTVVGHKKKK